jgi:hypothetical protein
MGMFNAQQIQDKGSCAAALNLAITLYARAVSDAGTLKKGEGERGTGRKWSKREAAPTGSPPQEKKRD